MSGDPYGKKSIPTKPKVPAVDTKRGHEDPTEVRCPTCGGNKVCRTCGNRGHVPLDVAAGIEDDEKRRERCTCQ
jgi:hypothetical protein